MHRTRKRLEHPLPLNPSFNNLTVFNRCQNDNPNPSPHRLKKTIKDGACKKDAQACAGALAVTKQRGGMALIERMALIHGVIDEHYFDNAMRLSDDNFELGA